MTKQVERDQLLRQGQRDWYECRDCDFVGYGQPVTAHDRQHPTHLLFHVYAPRTRTQPDHVTAGLEREAKRDELRDDALTMAERSDEECGLKVPGKAAKP